MASIRGVNVPMFTTLRRTTVFFTMIMEFVLVGQRHSNPIILRSVASLDPKFYYHVSCLPCENYVEFW
jgi:hypothetical protein